MSTPYKAGHGLRKILASTKYSLEGLYFLLKTERSFRQESVLIAITLIIAFYLQFPNLLELIFAAVLVLAFEAANTAIECVCDAVTLDHNVSFKRAKDAASFCVFLMLVLYFGVLSAGLYATIIR